MAHQQHNNYVSTKIPPQLASPTETSISYIKEFNSIIKKITCDLVIRYPHDAIISRTKKRIFLAIDLTPALIINAVGHYLYRYRNQIYTGDTSFFINNNYDDELKESVNIENANIVSSIIPKIKNAWAASDAAHQEQYKNIVQNLLDIYIEYLALQMSISAKYTT